MPRKRREGRKETHLARFLTKLLTDKKITLRAAAEIAGCSASVVSDWKQGGYPSTPETVEALQRLCTYYGVSLSLALTGTPEPTQIHPSLEELFGSSDLFEGYLQVTIKRLIPHGGKKS